MIPRPTGFALAGPWPDAFAALLASVALVAVLAGLRRAARRLGAWIESRAALRAAAPEIAGAELLARPNPLAGDKVKNSLLMPLRIAHGALALAAVAFWAYLLFRLFPPTRTFADALLDTFAPPLLAVGAGIAGYLPKLAYIAVVLLFAFVAIRVLRFAFAELGKGTLALPGFPGEWAEPTYRIVRFFALVFAAVLIYPYLPGAETRAFEGISLFIGALVSLGSSAAVANVIAGAILTYTHAFRVGDRVRIADTEGDVIGRALLATRIRSNKNVDITIPNARILAEHIVNYSAVSSDQGLIVHDEVTAGYDVPWRRVHELLIDAALRTAHVLPEPRPYVLQTGLDDFYARYTINAYTREANRMTTIHSDLRHHIQDAFHDNGIEITSPHFLALRDGSRLNLPDAPPASAATPLRVALVANPSA